MRTDTKYSNMEALLSVLKNDMKTYKEHQIINGDTVGISFLERMSDKINILSNIYDEKLKFKESIIDGIEKIRKDDPLVKGVKATIDFEESVGKDYARLHIKKYDE
jgi:hypothetical protein